MYHLFRMTVQVGVYVIVKIHTSSCRNKSTFSGSLCLCQSRTLSISVQLYVYHSLAHSVKLSIIDSPYLFYRYPVVLKAGWYCAPVNSHYVTSLLTDNLTSTTNDSAVSASGNLEICPVLETIVIKIILLLVGIAILIGCNVSVALELRRRPFGDAVSREMDRKFAIIMGVVALLFLLTWLPNLVKRTTFYIFFLYLISV